MNVRSTYFFAASLVLLSFFGGCKKKQNAVEKTTKAKKNSLKKHTNAQAFDLDSDSMKSFAIDDNISKHTSLTESSKGNSALFSWEDASAEESKKQFQTLYFDFDKDYLKQSEEAKLEKDITEAKKMIKAGKTIVIEGHACHSSGSRVYNMAISERRARFVASKFAEAGINSSDIKIAPRGQEMPVIKGGNREQQAPNRRVEIYAINSK